MIDKAYQTTKRNTQKIFKMSYTHLNQYTQITNLQTKPKSIIKLIKTNISTNVNYQRKKSEDE